MNLKSVRDLQVDDENHLAVVDMVHHKIHEATHFEATEISATLGDGDSTVVMMTTPASGRMHFEGFVGAGLGGLLELREAPTISGSGSAMVAMNNDRSSTVTPTMTIRSSATYSASGTFIAAAQIGSTGGGTKTGGAGGFRREFILKQSTIYLMRFTSQVAANETTLTPSWYEVT